MAEPIRTQQVFLRGVIATIAGLIPLPVALVFAPAIYEFAYTRGGELGMPVASVVLAVAATLLAGAAVGSIAAVSDIISPLIVLLLFAVAAAVDVMFALVESGDRGQIQANLTAVIASLLTFIAIVAAAKFVKRKNGMRGSTA